MLLCRNVGSSFACMCKLKIKCFNVAKIKGFPLGAFLYVFEYVCEMNVDFCCRTSQCLIHLTYGDGAQLLAAPLRLM